MRLRLLIVFLLIITIPMVAIGWLSYKAQQDDREIAKHSIIALLNQKLAKLDESISELIKGYERKLSKLDINDYSIASLRKVVRSIPAVHQLLVLDKRGKRIFPSLSSYSRPERDFILRAKPFIETYIKGSNDKKRKLKKRSKKQLHSTTSNSNNKFKKKYLSKSQEKKWSREKASNSTIRIEQHLYANTYTKKASQYNARQKRPYTKQLGLSKAITSKSRLNIALSKSNVNTYKSAPKKAYEYKKGKQNAKDYPRQSTSMAHRWVSIPNSAPSPNQKTAPANESREKPANVRSATADSDTALNSSASLKNRAPGGKSNINAPALARKSIQRSDNRTKIETRRQLKIRRSEERREKVRKTAETKKLKAIRQKAVNDHLNQKSISSAINGRITLSKPKTKIAANTKKDSIFQDLRGWSIGFRKNGINLIYSYRKADGYLIAAEISRTRLIHDIIRLLPISKTKQENGDQSLVTLTNARGDVVYKWGSHTPATNAKPLVSYSLSVPLNAWKFNYYSHKLNLSNAIHYAPFAIGLSAIFIAVMGLAFYFYRESNRELTVASQRVTFVNQVSHELKTPLTNIRMYAELLDQDLEEADDNTRNRMQVIVNESQRLSRMIINVLNFARHQRKQLRVIRSLRNVDDSIKHVLEQVTPALERQNIEVDFKANASQEINIDADIFEQILHNLISNVEKYAYTGHYLGISSYIHGNFVEVEISDKGPGIPKNMINKIFEAFYRGDNRLSEGVSGTGIGLSISRELARLHGGDLVLSNNRSGTTFKLTLNTKADS